MKKKLSKELGFLDVFAIATGAMISSGFFLLPGIAASKAGPAVIGAYVLAGFMILPALFSIVELSTAMPRSGGTYFFISRSLGPMFGTIEGVGDWLALILKCSIALVGLGFYLATMVNLSPTLLAVIFALLFTFLNLIYPGAVLISPFGFISGKRFVSSLYRRSARSRGGGICRNRG